MKARLDDSGFDLLAALLEHSGFVRPAQRAFGEGRDPVLLVDTPARACESLYVEAEVPVS